MRILVDLNRCHGYAQCVYLAHEVFKLTGDEALSYEPNPDESQRLHIERPNLTPRRPTRPSPRENDG